MARVESAEVRQGGVGDRRDSEYSEYSAAGRPRPPVQVHLC